MFRALCVEINMFRKEVKPVDDLVRQYLRFTGLETPLLQRRLIDAWPEVTGPTVAKYTQQRFIHNQTLCVKITNAALRAELSMMRTQLVKRLNEHIGSQVIADVRLF